MFKFFKRKREFKRGYEFVMRNQLIVEDDIHVYSWLYADKKDFLAGMTQAANELKASSTQEESAIICEKRLIKGEQA